MWATLMDATLGEGTQDEASKLVRTEGGRERGRYGIEARPSCDTFTSSENSLLTQQQMFRAIYLVHSVYPSFFSSSFGL